MSLRRHTSPSSNGTGRSHRPGKEPRAHPPARKRRWRIVLLVLFVLAALIGIGRAFLPTVVRDYVNRTLDRSPLYSGKIGDVQIHLWRGAYSIQEVRISKTTANIPVPFFAAKRVDFAIQWSALRHGRLVGRVLMDQPELNFVDAPVEDGAQTGGGGPWLEMIRDLFPFKINRALINDGSIHFRAFGGKTPVDVYLSGVQAAIDNLGNIRDETKPLVSTVHAKGLVMNQARFAFNMTLNPFSYRPTFRLAARVLGLDVTTINDLARSYGKFDFKHGWFDFVVEMNAEEGRLSGYAKPLFRNLVVFRLGEDIKNDNPVKFLWQAILGGVTTAFKNQPRDQFGTLIPFTADASGGTTPDILATIGNTLRNAFVRAYLPRLESTPDPSEGLHFEPPEFTEALSVGNDP